MTEENAVMAEKLIVPTHLVPPESLRDFTATVKDSDGEDFHINFFEHDLGRGVTCFARGNIPLIEKHFGHLEIEDMRVAVRMRMPRRMMFRGTLRGHQQKVAAKLEEIFRDGHGYGVICAPPRFGKTVLMTYITCRLGLKALFLSHQVDLSKQALQTFYRMTDVLDLEYDEGRALIGMVEKWEDLDRYQVAFLPYQKFVTGKNAFENLQNYKDSFGLVFIDESHRANAREYSRVVSAFNARYRMGVTATPKIKSKMHVISNFMLGPVVARGKAPQVPCEARVVKTGIRIPFVCTNSKFFFNQMYNFLANHDARNAYIAQYIKAYADAGHSCIAVAERNTMLDRIAKMLRDAGVAAETFHGKSASGKKAREAILGRARSGETRVLVASRKMVLGLDIPRLSAFFNLLPSANPPNYYQELSRVRTPFEGKEKAYIIDFEDSHPVVEACLKSRAGVYKKEKFELVEA
jgi:superfamily II DNA or RNA helicase